MGTWSLWVSVQAEFKPLRKTRELTASQRAKQTQRRRLRDNCIPLLGVQCWQSKWHKYLTAIYFFFLETLVDLGLYLYKGEEGIYAYAYPITMHINLLNIHFIYVCKWCIYMYKYICVHIYMWFVHIYINIYAHEQNIPSHLGTYLRQDFLKENFVLKSHYVASSTPFVFSENSKISLQISSKPSLYPIHRISSHIFLKSSSAAFHCSSIFSFFPHFLLNFSMDTLVSFYYSSFLIEAILHIFYRTFSFVGLISTQQYKFGHKH